MPERQTNNRIVREGNAIEDKGLERMLREK
jgi:hypothetical protein